MIPVHIEFEGLAELQAAWAKAPDLVAEELTAAIWEASLYLQREVQEGTPVGATSLLRNSIIAQAPERDGERITGEVTTGLSYAAPVEIGTRPHFPPIAPLQDWAVAKLGVSAEESRGVAFAIARKIAREGTQGAKMFERAFNEGREQVTAIVERAAVRVRDRLSQGRA